MDVVNSLKQCMRVLRLHAWSRVVKNKHMGSMALEQRRHFRYDDRYNFHDGKEGSKMYAEEGFDPRIDDRHYKNFQRNEHMEQSDMDQRVWNSANKETESRRRIIQDTVDHQRRQARIIQENKRRWQHRSEPKNKYPIEYTYDNDVLAAGTSKKRRLGRQAKEDKAAEDYSKRRRHQRQTEKQRQERELRESRKGYNLPKSEIETEQTSGAAPDTLYASRAWLEKRAREDEAKYWHSWQTCPEERSKRESNEEADDDDSPRYEPTQRRGFVKPPHSYDGSVRSYQTNSRQLTERPHTVAPPKYVLTRQAAIRRKPSGMEKQYLLARDFTRLNRSPLPGVANPERLTESFRYKHHTSLLQSHVFNKPTSVYADKVEEDQLEDIELPRQPPRTILAWQGLPRPVYKRFDGIKRAIAHQKKVHCKSTKTRVQPPRFQMTVKSKALKRPRTPMESFSNQLAVNTSFIPHSEYTGYGRQTVCDAWQNFTNVHNGKSIS